MKIFYNTRKSMNCENIYLVINFETDDIAEQMIREEDEKYPTVS